MNWWVCMSNIYGPDQGRHPGWHPLPATLFWLHVPSLLLFFNPICYFLCWLCLTLSLLVILSVSVCVCLCVGFFSFFSLGEKKAQCLWSINPLNAIKHTMHRRWPFKTCLHSLQTHSCSCAIGSFPYVLYQCPLHECSNLLGVQSSNFYSREKNPLKICSWTIRPVSDDSV